MTATTASFHPPVEWGPAHHRDEPVILEYPDRPDDN